jgi:hypothetical protein
LQLNTRGVLSDLKDKNLKHWGREKGVVLHLEKLFAAIHRYESFSLFWCGKLIPEVCPSILNTPCIYIQGFHYMALHKHDISAKIV